MKNLIALIISGALVVSGYSQTRNVLVGTNNAVVQPTNFWSGDASNARTGLGLGSAATNPASAFQPSSLVLSNLSISNGGSLTNLTASSVVGTLSIGQGGTGSTNASNARTALGLGSAATNPATAFQASSINLTNLAANNGGALTNLAATSIVGTIPSSNISTVSFTNIGGTLSIASGGTSATNAANARQNLGSTTIGDALFISTNAASARITIGATTVGSSVFTLANPSAITFLRLNADNTATALSDSGFRTAIGLGTAATNPASAFQPSSTVLSNLASSNGSSLTNIPVAGVVGALATNGDAINLTNFPSLLLRTNGSAAGLTNFPANLLTTNGNGAGLTNLTAANITGTVGLASNVTGTIAISNGGSGATTAGGARTNLGLGAGNDPTFNSLSVSYIKHDTNDVFIFDENPRKIYGDWEMQNGTFSFLNATNAATTRTNLGLGATWLTNNNVTNFRSSILPSYSGNSSKILAINSGGTDIEWVTNAGGGSSLAIPVAILNGGTGATNAATARTNLGLGATWLTNTVESSFRSAVGLGTANAVTFGSLDVTGTINVTNKELTRTNLGLGAAWLTNTNVTNFRTAIELGVSNFVRFEQLFATDTVEIGSSTNTIQITTEAIEFGHAGIAAATRTNLGVPSSFGSGSNSVIGGGLSNTSSGLQSVIGGGLGNTASGQNSFVGGGSANVASSVVSVVAGGNQNQALGGFNGIVGGTRNIIDYAEYSFIGGGDSNKIVAVNGGLQSASIVGGWQNNILQNTNLGSLSSWSFIGGGKTNNIIDSSYASIVSGSFNVINSTSPNSSIVSGNANSINNSGQSFIGNGSVNSIDGGFRSIIVNGSWNFASNNFSTVINGEYSTASANYSLASGRRAKATNGGSFVFTDSQDADFSSTNDNSFNARFSGGMFLDLGTNGISFANSTSAAVTRSNLGIGGTNSGTFNGLVNNGNLTNNGTIYVFATNVGTFEGVANLINSNNTTLSNETLFRVGLAEATNRSAQFGFRVARTNNGGEGLAVFSVYGYNALMMIGPSDRSRTNTNVNAPIEADIFTIDTTNRVMTLRDTNSGALTLHQELGFSTNNITTNAPANTTNVVLWLRVWIGTNTYSLPLYQ